MSSTRWSNIRKIYHAVRTWNLNTPTSSYQVYVNITRIPRNVVSLIVLAKSDMNTWTPLIQMRTLGGRRQDGPVGAETELPDIS